MFQTVYSFPPNHQIMVVHCHAALQFNICLLSRPLSSHAKQAVTQEPFTSTIQIIANVYSKRYLVMIVPQQVAQISSLLT
jgi:hypothetical protein